MPYAERVINAAIRISIYRMPYAVCRTYTNVCVSDIVCKAAYLCRILYVGCRMPYAACRVCKARYVKPCAVCHMPHAAYAKPGAVCCAPYAICCMPYVLPYAVCRMFYVVCCMLLVCYAPSNAICCIFAFRTCCICCMP